MPELPEVETMCRGIRSVIGRRIAGVGRPVCSFRPIRIRPAVPLIDEKLKNQIVSDVTRLGKRVLLHAAGYALILQPKMSGLVTLGATPDDDHVRLQIEFSGRPRLMVSFWDRRGLGTVELIRQLEIERRIVLGRLGPDALSIDLKDFSNRLSGTRRAIKVALLDQRLLAGIGNLYASEMLHRARIHPAHPCDSLSLSKKRRLFEVMRGVLLDAIEHEGSTLSDGTYRNALNDPGSYQSRHLVYDRAALPCPTCSKSTIRRIVQAQRSTFYCPRCQRKPRMVKPVMGSKERLLRKEAGVDK